MMSKRDIILIAVTVMLVGLMIGGFIYDRTPALLDRTNPYIFSEDENLKIIACEKKGFMFRRVYYEAKLQILDNYWEQYFVGVADATGNEGLLMSKAEYLQYQQTALTHAVLKPVPRDNAIVWRSGMEFDDHSLIYILDQEDDGNAYFYIYYSRK